MKFSYYIWGLYLIVYPLYFFDPGDPQIADIFGVLLIGLNFKSILLGINSNTLTRCLFLFVIYSFLVNTSYMLILGNEEFQLPFFDRPIKSSFYYVYSFFMLLFVFSKIKDKDFLKLTFYSIGISMFIQFLSWLFLMDRSGRSQMFFTNPNQLAFWALTMLLIISIVTNIIKPKKLYSTIIIILCTFFMFISASKAAILGIVIYWFYFFVKSRKYLLIFSSVILISILFISANKDFSFERISIINNIFNRITEKKPQGHSGLQGRGYDRIFRYPQYLLLGSGEAKGDRFDSDIELHSTFFNILFSYGIIGLALFLTGISPIFKRAPTEVIIYFMILVLYTLVHMTLRSPLFWVTLILLLRLKEHKLDDLSLVSND